MKLDESIELQDIKKINPLKIKEMKGLSKNINVDQMRKYLSEVMESEQSYKLLEILTNEGYLNVNEVDGAQIQFEELLHDDEICQEMYESYVNGIQEYQDYYSDFVKIKDDDDDDKEEEEEINTGGDEELVEVETEENSEENGEEANQPIKLPKYLQQKQNFFDLRVKKMQSFIQKGTPESKGLSYYFEKMNPQDFIRIFHLKDFNLTGFVEFLSQLPNETPTKYYERLTKTGEPVYVKVYNDFVQPNRRRFITQKVDELRPQFNTTDNDNSIQSELSLYDNMEETLNEISALDDLVYNQYLELQDEKQKIETRQDKRNFIPKSKTKLTDLGFDEKNPDFDADVDITPDQDEELPIDTLPDEEYGDLDFDDEEDYDNSSLNDEDYDEDNDDFLAEEIIKEIKAAAAKGMAIKGQAVDHDNQVNANKENQQMTTDAEKSQKTVQQKVDNLKRQKYERNTEEQDNKDTSLGSFNNLDLDYNGGLTKDQEDRIEDLADGLPDNEDDANVDHEATGGKKLIDAAKKRKDDDIDGYHWHYSTPPARYQKVDEHVARMKELIKTK